jgi:hypothetical protein
MCLKTRWKCNTTNKQIKVNRKAWGLPKSRSSHIFIVFTPIHFTILTWLKCAWFDNLWLCLDKVPFTQSLSSLQDKLIDKKWHGVVSLLQQFFKPSLNYLQQSSWQVEGDGG